MFTQDGFSYVLCPLSTGCSTSWEVMAKVLKTSLLCFLCVCVFGFCCHAIALQFAARMRKSLGAPFISKFEHGMVSILDGRHLFMGVMNLCCLLQLAIYIKTTYQQNIYLSWYIVEIVICALYLTERFIRFLLADNKFRSCFSGEMFIDIFIVSGVLTVSVTEDSVTGSPSHLTLSFLSSLRLIHTFRKLHENLSGVNSEVNLWFQLSGLVMFIIGLIFFAAGLVFTVESLGELSVFDAAFGGEPLGYVTTKWTFFSAFYFTMVTISTVGYGDITPQTVLGKFCALFFICGGIAAFSLETARMFDVLKLNRQGRGAFFPVKGMKHVIVTGDAPFSIVRDFLLEFFHPDRENGDTTVVFLAAQVNKYSATLRRWLRQKSNLRFKKLTQVFEGTPLDFADMKRMHAHAAESCFVLPNIHNHDSFTEDAQMILRILAIKRFFPRLRVICLLLRAENRQILLTSGIHRGDIVCVDEFKLELLGKNCIVPGFSTLICNLIRASSQTEDQEESCVNQFGDWSIEYAAGAGKEIYTELLSTAYAGRRFMDVAIDVLRRSSNKDVTLIGITLPVPYAYLNGQKVLLNPGKDYVLPVDMKKIRGIFIANNRSDIKQPDCLSMSAIAKSPVTGRARSQRSSVFGKLFTSPVPSVSCTSPAKVVPVIRPPVKKGLSQTRSVLAFIQRADQDGGAILQKSTAQYRERIEYLISTHERSKHLPVPTVSTLAEGGHIIICANIAEHSAFGLQYFIRPLRASHSRQNVPVVVLSPHPPADWSHIVDYEDVFYVKGSPLSSDDLELVGFQQASAILVISNSKANRHDEAAMADAEAIFTMRLIEANTPRAKPVYTVIELVNDSNSEFLASVLSEEETLLARLDSKGHQPANTALESDKSPRTFVEAPSSPRTPKPSWPFSILPANRITRRKSEKDTDSGASALVYESNQKEFFRQPRFASGSFFVSSILTSMMAATYDHGEITQIIEELNSAEISQLPVPSEFVTKSYLELFEHLVGSVGVVPLGLYRYPRPSQIVARDKDKPLPFVYTAPPGCDTLLRHNDRVFVIRPERIGSGSGIPTRSHSPASPSHTPGAVSYHPTVGIQLKKSTSQDFNDESNVMKRYGRTVSKELDTLSVDSGSSTDMRRRLLKSKSQELSSDSLLDSDSDSSHKRFMKSNTRELPTHHEVMEVEGSAETSPAKILLPLHSIEPTTEPPLILESP
eukprot:GILJ01012423.1.p1 GENE.GILJ01012423.1~~GILJ01012423.1.p1  ORF type:complete len:1205 (+),score=162.60 GILJ01012423.1:94-3708(+)